MGVVNVTPDSFSDGGAFGDAAARDRPRPARSSPTGADILDVGGESTRPGAEPVAGARGGDARPAGGRGARRRRCTVSIDTYKAEVARGGARRRRRDRQRRLGRHARPRASARGRAPRRATSSSGTCAATPATMQAQARYTRRGGRGDATSCASASTRRVAAGVSIARILVDPGLGFAKSAERTTWRCWRGSASSRALGCPIVVGASRKSFLGALTGRGVGEREAGDGGGGHGGDPRRRQRGARARRRRAARRRSWSPTRSRARAAVTS